jgi:hypothetical protein
MAESERSRWAIYRDRKRGGPPRKLRPHGTVAGYRRHQRAGEEPCDPCRVAWSDYQHELYLKREGLDDAEIAKRMRARKRQRH